jgi:MOSC domain-containing protein YiiM
VTFDELEQAWLSAPPLPRDRGTVLLICVRKGGGVHECPARVGVTVGEGVAGDRWSLAPERDPEAQVTLMSMRVAELVTAARTELDAAGDNFLVDFDLSEDALPAGTILTIGTARLVVSAKPHAGCRKFLDRFGGEALRWVNGIGRRERRLRGVNCRVVQSGEVALGDPIARS